MWAKVNELRTGRARRGNKSPCRKTAHAGNAARYGINLTVVTTTVDPTFRFMTADWDGQIRMDPSSRYTMQSLIDLKGGNNNAYCQDNETSWYDWRRLEQHKEIFRFTRGMIAFRRAHPILSKEQFYTDAEIHWFGPHEEGKLTLEEYLGRVVFYRKRPFTRAQFQRFMFAQSKPYPEMIELVAQLKVRRELKIVVVSNEARELNSHRIKKFKLDRFVDSFVSSCFVHVRKPDADIFRLALDIAQTPVRKVVYIENTPMFVRIAKGLGIRSILHTSYTSTCAKLASIGLHNGA